MIKFIKWIFRNSSDRKALNSLQNYRNLIATEGGAAKVVKKYILDDYEEPVKEAINILGFDFQEKPDREMLNIACLELLYVARAGHLQKLTKYNLERVAQDEISAEECAEAIVDAAVGKGHRDTEVFALAKRAFGLIARRVDGHALVPPKNHVDTPAGPPNNPEEHFNASKQEVAENILANFLELQVQLDFVSTYSKKKQVEILVGGITKLGSERIDYWSRMADQKFQKELKSFENWEATELETLKKLVNG